MDGAHARLAGPHHRAAPKRLPLGDIGQAHLIGACRPEMQSLAIVLSGLGWRLTGSDASLYRAQYLRGARLRIVAGHSARHLPHSADCVIYADDVSRDNGMRRAAAQRGAPTLSHSQFVSQLLHDRAGIVFAGGRPASTAAAILANILVEAERDPCVLLRATPLDWQSGGRHGAGHYLVVEAPLAQNSTARPQAAALLDADDYAGALRLARSVAPEGLLAVNAECPAALQAAEAAPCRTTTFGAGGQWRGENLRGERGCYSFTLVGHDQPLGECRLRVAGRHQAQAALAALAVAGELKIEPATMLAAASRHAGLRNRAHLVAESAGVTMVRDDAQDPASIAEALATIREMLPGRRLWCVFEPDSAAMMMSRLDAFAASLHNADRVLVTDAVRGGDADERLAATDALVRRLPTYAAAVAEPCPLGLVDRLAREAVGGDVVALIGAGDIGNIAHALAKRLRRDLAPS